MKSIFPVIFISAILFYAVPFVAAADTASGKEVFAKKCASCHGAAGEGNEKIAQLMKVEIKNLGAKEIQSKSDAELKKIVAEGSGKMKPPKDITDKSIDDVVAYLRTLAKK